MIRGSTPTHTFELPFDVKYIKDGRISYMQDGAVVLEKQIDDCTLEGQVITVKLTQEETLLFNCFKGYVYIQIKLLTQNGEVIYSDDEIKEEVERCFNEEVLT